MPSPVWIVHLLASSVPPSNSSSNTTCHSTTARSNSPGGASSDTPPQAASSANDASAVNARPTPADLEVRKAGAPRHWQSLRLNISVTSGLKTTFLTCNAFVLRTGGQGNRPGLLLSFFCGSCSFVLLNKPRLTPTAAGPMLNAHTNDWFIKRIDSVVKKRRNLLRCNQEWLEERPLLGLATCAFTSRGGFFGALACLRHAAQNVSRLCWDRIPPSRRAMSGSGGLCGCRALTAESRSFRSGFGLPTRR